MEDNTKPEGLFKTLAERVKANTPPFFKKLRVVGLVLAAAGGALVAAPIALPAIVTTVAGYFIVAGTVATAVSQVAVQDEESGS